MRKDIRLIKHIGNEYKLFDESNYSPEIGADGIFINTDHCVMVIGFKDSEFNNFKDSCEILNKNNARFPTLHEVVEIITNFEEINKYFLLVTGKELDKEHFYWTSQDISDSHAYVFSLSIVLVLPKFGYGYAKTLFIYESNYKQ